ncbi:hypothetical protein [Microbacterium sp. zg-YB36]|uniref:hypothetical protein n=1 Tax=Microbacterium sp. zg-YB36 TaxID=2969407 RepID=UPI00214C77AF|nr:hypothetical protein [Microbacterium sp. zg-YB36]MDL5351135.1 hypothetical protein [Microbacterium sp. zg-YB36]
MTTEDLLALHAAGTTAVEIARRMGIPEWQVRRRLREAGVPAKPLRRLTAEERDWVMRSRAEGVPAVWIAETLDIQGKAVSRLCRNDAETDVWQQTWPQIFKDAELLKLHQEFSPKKKVKA